MPEQRPSKSIQWKWVAVSLAIFLVVQLAVYGAFAILGILTFGFGFILFLIAKPVVYFLGGYVTGRLSAGVTIKEPAIGAVIISVLGTVFDAARVSSGRGLGMVISGLVAFALALWGARFGERTQEGNRY